jgi:hypothetical protein
MPSLLTLPRELRFNIYSYLCGREAISYPFHHSPITSITHTPPPVALYLTCRALAAEIQSYFYSLATLRFVSLPTQWNHPPEHYEACLRALRYAKRVEIVLIWEVKVHHVNAGVAKLPWSMRGFLEQTVNLLLKEATNLELVILSVRDASDREVGWDFKKGMLTPINGMARKARIALGHVTAEEEREDELKGGLGEYMGELKYC